MAGQEAHHTELMRDDLEKARAQDRATLNAIATGMAAVATVALVAVAARSASGGSVAPSSPVSDSPPIYDSISRRPINCYYHNTLYEGKIDSVYCL